jgi:hypothetical protein
MATDSLNERTRRRLRELRVQASLSLDEVGGASRHDSLDGLAPGIGSTPAHP